MLVHHCFGSVKDASVGVEPIQFRTGRQRAQKRPRAVSV